MVWKLVQGSGVMTTDDAVEVTNDATTSAIESVQTVTSFFHLPTWFGRLIFILIAVFVMLMAVKLVNKAFRHTVDAMTAAGNTSVTLIAFARYVAVSYTHLRAHET